jgi:hypothetical protein
MRSARDSSQANKYPGLPGMIGKNHTPRVVDHLSTESNFNGGEEVPFQPYEVLVVLGLCMVLIWEIRVLPYWDDVKFRASICNTESMLACRGEDSRNMVSAWQILAFSVIGCQHSVHQVRSVGIL